MNNMDDFWVLSTNVYGYPMVIHVIHIIPGKYYGYPSWLWLWLSYG